MLFIRMLAIGLVTLCLLVFPAVAAEKAIIILDGSGSMWAQIDGKPKLEIARESLRTVLQSVPADDEIGFMAYGHREKGSCDDIQLIVPPQAGSASAKKVEADGLKVMTVSEAAKWADLMMMAVPDELQGDLCLRG